MVDQEEEDRFHSRSVDAAAIRLSERDPEAEVDHAAPLAVPEIDAHGPNRHSASAEAAALRWQENHPDEE